MTTRHGSSFNFFWIDEQLKSCVRSKQILDVSVKVSNPMQKYTLLSSHWLLEDVRSLGKHGFEFAQSTLNMNITDLLNSSQCVIQPDEDKLKRS